MLSLGYLSTSTFWAKLSRCLILLVISSHVFARWGDFDPTFNGTGFVKTGFREGNDAASGSVLQPDGKLVIAGTATGVSSDFSVSRFNFDGTLDGSFGSGGSVITAFREGEAYANAVALQSDGKIVVGGAIFFDTNWSGGRSSKIALARYNSSGSLDRSFGSGGKVTYIFGETINIALALAIQPDGKILIANEVRIPGSLTAIARLNSDGSIDTSFGSEGTVLIGSMFLGRDLILQADGKIALGGSVIRGAGETRLAAARLNPDGTFDQTFGGSGLVIYESFNGGAYSIRVQSDGKLILAAASTTLGGALCRLNTDGIPDMTFDQDGFLFGTFGRLAIQSDGKLLVAAGGEGFVWVTRVLTSGSVDPSFGTSGVAGIELGKFVSSSTPVAIGIDGKLLVSGSISKDLFALRLHDNGGLDVTFGTKGIAIEDAANYALTGRAIKIQPDGKVLLTGGDNAIHLVRYNPNGTLDSDFNGNGKVRTLVGEQSHATALDLQQDGKVLVTGSAYRNGQESLLLVRYASDGTLDSTFGDGGIVLFRTGISGAALVVEPNGGIIVAAKVFGAVGASHSSLFRFSSDGSLDTWFGDSGQVVIANPPSGVVMVRSIARQADGKLVIAGKVGYGDGAYLARYNSNGSLDLTFNNSGTIISTGPFGYLTASCVKIQTDGKLAVAGTVPSLMTVGSAQFALLRFTGDGTPDTTLNGTGVVTTIVGSEDADAMSLALDSSGNYVVAGWRRRNSFFGSTRTNQTVLVRFDPFGRIDGGSRSSRAKKVFNFPGGDNFSDIAVDTNARFVAGGTIDDVFGVARLENDPDQAKLKD